MTSLAELTTGTQHRTVELHRSQDGDGRSFTGIAVPYDDEVTIYPGFRESFAPGSIVEDDQILFWRHLEPIGTYTGTDTPAGRQIDARISDTAQGRDAATLMRDGAITRLSVGFEPRTWEETKHDDGTVTIRHTAVRVREVSMVPHPAYDNATITDHRNQNPPATLTIQEHPMDPETLTRADLTPLSEQLADLDRAVKLLGTPAPPAAGHQWRSMGEFLKAIAAGDQDAADFHRAYTGATTADTVMKDSFVGEFIKLVQDRRRIAALFGAAPLPPDGLSVDYVKLKTDTTQVAEQATQGADLVSGKVTLEAASAPVKTYGGYTELSLQLIERSTVPSLDTTLTALALKYAAVTDGAVSAAFKALETENAASGVVLGAAATSKQWLDAIVDVAMALEAKDMALGGLVVNVARFKQLNDLKDGTNRLMKVYGDGYNQVGELNLTAVAGNLAGVKVTASTKVTEGGFYDPQAIQFRESAGAPAQLQDSNIINLSKSFSLYGYAAVLTPFPGGVIPIKND